MMRPVELGHVEIGEGPTVVAVHGGLLSGRLTYGPVLGDWADRLRVLVPDRRGFERSPGPGGTIAEQARDLETFIDARAGGHAHVVAFSFGALVALTALQLERRLFASLTVVEAPAVTLAGADAEALGLRSWLAELHDTAVGGDGRAAAHAFFAFMDHRALGRIDALLDSGDPGVHVALDELRVWQTPLSPVGLAGAAVPVLVVTGERSPTVMHRLGNHVARATGGTHVVQRAAGHAAHLIGRPFRDRLCAHVAAAEAARSWDDPVELVPWDPAWATRFARERAAIADVLGDRVGAIEHIGSTAVEGLAAKPVIDIAVGVADSAAIDAAAGRLRAAGYAPSPDREVGHRFALRRGDGRRLAHAHVVVHDGPWWRDHVGFRDLLRADVRLRDAYAAHKRELAARHAGDREAYTDAKARFVATARTGPAGGRP
jgi:GrpB-like predicted nucleotidyltransferase (UPF0157 family)/pimeloyl-ACP methyl ester carboxylesterase